VEIVELRDVALQGSDVLADVLGGCGQLGLAASGYERVGTFLEEAFCRRQPDAAAAAGDESDFAVELTHGPLLFCVLQANTGIDNRRICAYIRAYAPLSRTRFGRCQPALN